MLDMASLYSEDSFSMEIVNILCGRILIKKFGDNFALYFVPTAKFKFPCTENFKSWDHPFRTTDPPSKQYFKASKQNHAWCS